MYLEQEFAYRAISYRPRFKQMPGSKFKLNCRCMICGDSAESEFKARFWIYEKNGRINVKCFNCDYSNSLIGYLREEDEDLYREYLIEKRKESGGERPKTVSPEYSKLILKESTENIKTELESKLEKYCQCLTDLPLNHPIVKYVQARHIPEKLFNRFYFTKDWRGFVNACSPGTYPDASGECRLVIPIWNADNVLESFQGRALVKDAKNKYITIKSHDNASKVYGCNLVKDGTVFVMEGPIDSMFIDNAIAITGGTLDLGEIPYANRRIFALDNEPRHPDTMKRLKRLIEAGEKVVLWDNWKIPGKDINDYIKNGATPESIVQYMVLNSFSGLIAKHRFAKYCKIVVR
ncbi:DNA primase [Pseudomonas phage PspYZU05]|uniref:DNA primase subunit n=1 Tax=Pseudomonas phage PspYZU05 TaxID=1983556 RepID=A0A2U7N2I6_9CAUD|nr:DNA primase [Pseudomonas phage PspYZU05]ASD52015.1 DNA primase subunit [Pseudomonas phage PspYZU05]